MRVISSDLDFADRLHVEVDQTAEPVDLDEAVAKFLLAVVERRSGDTLQSRIA